MAVGIESINAYGAQTYIDVRTLFEARKLDLERFNNLMMLQKSVNLPCEDPVTNAVNAAKPIIDQLTDTEKNSIELLITSTESGLDFGKSLSTYIHDYLGLSRKCRLFEVKQACYGGTAAVQMAANFIAAGVSPGAKALVIATDVARAAGKLTYMEPSQGVASIAMLVSNKPDILELDLGANGYHGYEVMDTCRPEPEIETGDSDLSLMSYLDCLEASYRAYTEKVSGVDLQTTFDYFAFHTPFAGMVKGAHRNLMRKFKPLAPDLLQADFEKRVAPSLQHCIKVGNVYSGTVYLALCSVIDHAEVNAPKRVGIYSYGSGCSSEFYSGIITPHSKQKLATMRIGDALMNRYALTMAEYDQLLDLNIEWLFGIKDKKVDRGGFADIYAKQLEGKGLLSLMEIKNYHRKYEWS
ncbi:MAG: hydroxymethylglutaryl-CoA synthase [Gammaproteobacteria bacterium]